MISIDLSNNSLEHIYELVDVATIFLIYTHSHKTIIAYLIIIQVELVNIEELNLSHNCMISLSANVASVADPNVQVVKIITPSKIKV